MSDQGPEQEQSSRPGHICNSGCYVSPSMRGSGWKRTGPYRRWSLQELDDAKPGTVCRVGLHDSLVLTFRKEHNGTWTVFSRTNVASRALCNKQVAACSPRGDDK